MPSTKKKVVVTGFGPFSGHSVNASWVSVQELARLGLTDDIDLIISEIPVEYCTVKKIIPSLWKQHNPDLIVHVGVSSIAMELTLEQQAHNDGYDKHDISGSCPPTQCCVEGADTCIKSDIDMQHVCNEVNNMPIKIKTVVSNDAGRYLCDFSYYQSLHIDKRKAAFIHVPPLGCPYTAGEIAEGLRAVILSMLKQMAL
ncbi:hypothetical protein SNE40_011386 [Patella caerulea]|uniref:Pyroglutamyl-peptidase I n=1 Tax=Patella caerulea TaxID=87958 RepID=A0AAN8PLK6_PATCE